MFDRRLPTRELLISGAFAAIQSVLFALVVPVTAVLAPSAPPLYALVAAIYSLLPFLARVVTGLPGTATITAGLAGLLSSAVSPIGVLSAVPMLVAGAVFDAVLLRARSPLPWWRLVLGAAAAGIALFFVSLPVFSAEHLTPVLLTATLLSRVIGEVAVALLARAVAGLLVRAGVRTGRRAR
jgi:hypothetical protein